MDPFVWIAWPTFCAVGGGVLVFFVMQSRTEVRLAEQREELAAARAALSTQKEALEDKMRHAEESARGRAMDEFLADIHVEERFYTRESKTLFATKKTLVRQERVFFRNIPLSSWIEHDMPVDEQINGATGTQALADAGREVRIPAAGKRGKKLLS